MIFVVFWNWDGSHQMCIGNSYFQPTLQQSDCLVLVTGLKVTFLSPILEYHYAVFHVCMSTHNTYIPVERLLIQRLKSIAGNPNHMSGGHPAVLLCIPVLATLLLVYFTEK